MKTKKTMMSARWHHALKKIRRDCKPAMVMTNFMEDAEMVVDKKDDLIQELANFIKNGEGGNDRRDELIRKSLRPMPPVKISPSLMKKDGE